MRAMNRTSVALLAIALGFSFGCSKKVDDPGLVTSIKAQLFSDDQTKNADLQVTSSNDQVTLAGTVPTDAAHLEAYKIATQTPGVAKVNDQMTVASAQSSAQAELPPPPPAAAQPAPPSKNTSADETAKQSAKELRRQRERERRKERAEQRAELAANNPPPPPPSAPVDQTPPPAAAPPQEAAPPPAPEPPPPPPPRQVPIPAGSTVTIRMIDGVDSAVNKPGEIFHASLEAPLVVDNEVIVPRGADIYVRLSNASSAGHLSGQSELHLELIKMEFHGESYPLVSSTYSVTGGSRGKNSAEKIGGGAVFGAIIGALAGGGKGAAIGAGAGAGAGTVYQAATHGKQVKIPSETKLDFQLDQPVTVTVTPRPNPAQ
jgi:hypothetical protein